MTGPQADSVLRPKRGRRSGWAPARLRSDELLIGSFAGSLRRRELDRAPRWRDDHVTVKQVVDDLRGISTRRGSRLPRCCTAPLRTAPGFEPVPYLARNPGNPVFVGEIGGLCGSENAYQNAKRLAVRLAVESQAGLRMSSSRHFEAVTLDDVLFRLRACGRALPTTSRQRRGRSWPGARTPGDHLYHAFERRRPTPRPAAPKSRPSRKSPHQ